MTDGPEIQPGEKYALITMRTYAPDPSSQAAIQITRGVWAWDRFPIALDDNWKEWIGSVREGILRNANLVLLAKMPSTTVDVADVENENLKREVYLLFQTILLSASVRIYDTPAMVTGSHRNGRAEMRQITEVPPPLFLPGSPIDQVTTETLSTAVALRKGIADLEASGGFKRLGRVYSIHQRALQNLDPIERIHQFCRSIEGFILPAIAKTTRQFKSRTELFVGPGHHDLMGRLYEMRSLVEHIHQLQFDDWPVEERERRLIVLREAIFLEQLSRHCISRLLINRALWPHFANDDALRAFWHADAAAVRRKTWGEPADITALRNRFESTNVSDSDLGLPAPGGKQ
jgi:hypothetical protein